MSDKQDNTMSDQGFIDAIGDKFREIFKPGVIVPGTPAPAPSGTLPAWLTHLLGMALAIALSFIAAKWGVTPTPLPSLQSQPQVLVVTMPAGATVEAVKK